MTDYSLPNISHDLTGHVALVTGATSGLGWNFAKVLAACGAKVAIAGRRAENLQNLKTEIEAAGGTCASYVLDVTDADALVQVVEQASADLGVIDILINNAGIPDAQLATKIPVELIDQVMDVNLRAPFILAREVAKRLIAEKKPGRIVNIASIAAFDYNGNGAALYSVVKAGVARMAEALAVEWGKFNINVNAIAPGAFASEMMDGMLERMGDITQYFPRKRLCVPAQMDSTLLYLCSPASDCVTGTVIKIDDAQSRR